MLRAPGSEVKVFSIIWQFMKPACDSRESMLLQQGWRKREKGHDVLLVRSEAGEELPLELEEIRQVLDIGGS